MNRKLVGFIVLIPLVLAGQAFCSGLAKSGSMDRTVTTRNSNASETHLERFMWEGDRLRAEKYTPDGLKVQIKNGRTLYWYEPSLHQAIKVVVPEKAAISVQQMLQAESTPVKDGKKVGSKPISGFSCDVYMLSKKVGGATRTGKLYMSKDSRLPIALRIEITMGKFSQIVDTKNIKLNANIPDSMFALPKGTKIVEKKVSAPGAPGATK